MKAKKTYCDVSYIFPDKSVLAQVFWNVILSCPIGFLLFLIMMIIEEVVEIIFIARIGFNLAVFNQYLNSLYESENMGIYLLIISGTLIGFYFTNLFIMWLLYRAVKK